MRVIMTGGGTGGHIYPAIAIADRIDQRTLNSEILFVGTEKGLEKDLVPKHGYDIKFINVSGISRKNMLKNIKVYKEYVNAKKQAKKIIEDFKPDIVIGTGGYVCGPVVKMAAKMGIKTCIHESNATPGLTNKMLASVVDTIFISFPEAGEKFKHKEKQILSGNPVRDEFFKARKNTSREKLGIGQDEFVLLAFGGSQGAGRINKSMMEVVEKYNGVSKVTVIFGTGKYYYKPILTELKEKGIEISENIRVLEYIDNMENYLSAADIVVSRSGALTVSEIAVCGTPAILIPSPNVTGNHQMHNALAIAENGGASILEEKDLTENALYKKIEEMRNNEELLLDMSQKAKECAPLDATDIIFYTINE
ncbi:MAG: undecaprenyldiphospho-muramoylpentapeptide beta-N-acetylglucosaminyltransferase [Anaerovoracaceae bacterium]